MEEIHRTSKKGFFVDLNSLKGVVATISSKFSAPEIKNRNEQIKVEFKDGSTQVIQDVEALSGLVNAGRKEVIGLYINYTAKSGGDELYEINLSLVDLSSPDKEEAKPISYNVRCPDQMWTKATQADLDEFVLSIERFDIASVSETIQYSLITAAMLSIMAIMYFNPDIVHHNTPENLKSLHDRLVAPGVSPGEALYRYEEWSSNKADTAPVLFLLIMFLPVVAITLFRRSMLEKIFKSRIFYFGGMVSIVNQRRVFHSIIWIGMILALTVGLTANYLSKILFR